jgi:hypothetical protein
MMLMDGEMPYKRGGKERKRRERGKKKAREGMNTNWESTRQGDVRWVRTREGKVEGKGERREGTGTGTRRGNWYGKGDGP